MSQLRCGNRHAAPAGQCSASARARPGCCHAVRDAGAAGAAPPLPQSASGHADVMQHAIQSAPLASTSGSGLINISDKVSPLSEKLRIPNDALVLGLLITQGVTLIGTYVTGMLARKRRVELTRVNAKLRTVIHELRKKQEAEVQSLVCEAAPSEADSAYQRALNASKSSAEQSTDEETVSAYGIDNMSLTTARRRVSKDLYDAKDCLTANDAAGALRALDEALRISDELTDKRARRAVLRVSANAHKMGGSTDATIADLNEALEISKQLDEYSGDVDTLGALADVYVDLGDLEKASQLYDQIINAIQVEDSTQALSSTWDC